MEAYLHVTAELNIPVLLLIFKYQSFEQVLYHSLHRLLKNFVSICEVVQLPESAYFFFFTVITLTVFISSHVKFRCVPANEGYSTAIPVWTANMVVQ